MSDTGRENPGNFRHRQSLQKKNTGGQPSDDVTLSSGKGAPMETEDDDLPRVKQDVKRFWINPVQLLQRLVMLQERADLLGKEQDCWDEVGYVGTLFPKPKEPV